MAKLIFTKTRELGRVKKNHQSQVIIIQTLIAIRGDVTPVIRITFAFENLSSFIFYNTGTNGIRVARYSQLFTRQPCARMNGKTGLNVMFLVTDQPSIIVGQ